MRRKTALLLCVLLCVCCALSGFAAASPDLTKEGSIRFRILSDYDPVPGGDLWLMRVATVETDAAGNLRYEWVPELSHLTIKPEDAFNYESAKLIRDEALKHGVTAERVWINNDGRATFERLKPGVYLFYQTVSPEGYEVIPPFLVTVPMRDGDNWIYDVDISPKQPVVPSVPTTPTVPTLPTVPTVPVTPPETTTPTNPTTPTHPTTPTNPTTPPNPTTPTEPTVPTGSTTPSEPTTPTKPSKTTEPSVPEDTTDHSKTEPSTTQPPSPELPNTGQLKWPVAVCAGVGGLLICCGLILYGIGKREEDAP